MSTLIVYAGKYGCTEDCAQQLKNKLSANADLVDLNENKIFDINKYDNIIIGSSVYAGRVNKKVKSFVDNNLKALLSKNIGLFLVCGQSDKYKEVMENNYPKELIDIATVECFGGELKLDKMGFMDRNIVKMICKELDIDSVQIIPSNIEKMAESFRESGE